ncbi:MAG: hypothetical protein ACLP1Q_15120 [Solirubrobacteraceae bacterium]
MTRSPRTAAQLDARALARAKREALRRRARRIRRAVAGLTMTLFAMAFLVIYAQLASGHDPALVANARKRAAGASAESTAAASSTSSATGTSTSAGESTSASESTGASESTSTGESGESSSGAAAVTTSQS